MRRSHVALVLAAAPALLLTGCLRDFEDAHVVNIVNLDVAPREIRATDIVMNVTTTLDNRGGSGSPALRLVAKAYEEDTGFLAAETVTEIAALAEDSTRTVSQDLVVPRRGSMRLDVALYEDDLGVARATVHARNLDRLEPAFEKTGLAVSEVDFVVRALGGNGSRARIETQLYLTNEGEAASEDLRVQVKAREITTRLIADTVDLRTGAIAPGATVVRSTNLTVADGYNYVFEMLVWRGDVVVDRHEGEVRLAPSYEIPKDSEVIVTDPNLRDFLSPTAPTGERGVGGPHQPTPGGGVGAAAAVPGFGALAAVAAVGAAVLVARGWRR